MAVRRSDQHNRIGVFLNMSCPDSLKVLQQVRLLHQVTLTGLCPLSRSGQFYSNVWFQASSTLLFNSSFAWFLWDARHPPSNLLDVAENFNLAVDSDVVICSPAGQDFALQAVEKVYYDLPLSARPLSVSESTTPRRHSGGRPSLTGVVIRTLSVVSSFTAVIDNAEMMQIGSCNGGCNYRAFEEPSSGGTSFKSTWKVSSPMKIPTPCSSRGQGCSTSHESCTTSRMDRP